MKSMSFYARIRCQFYEILFPQKFLLFSREMILGTVLGNQNLLASISFGETVFDTKVRWWVWKDLMKHEIVINTRFSAWLAGKQRSDWFMLLFIRAENQQLNDKRQLIHRQDGKRLTCPDVDLHQTTCCAIWIHSFQVQKCIYAKWSQWNILENSSQTQLQKVKTWILLKLSMTLENCFKIFCLETNPSPNVHQRERVECGNPSSNLFLLIFSSWASSGFRYENIRKC